MCRQRAIDNNNKYIEAQLQYKQEAETTEKEPASIIQGEQAHF